MSQRAKVTSVEAIEMFRTHLIVFLSKARPSVEEVTCDVSRMRSWLEHDQRLHWENEVRRRTKRLDEAQQALFSAEISNLREAMVVERMAVHKARRALDEANEKLKVVKRWSREFANRVDPLARQLERLHTVLVTETPKAVAHLTETVKTLHDYADVAKPMTEAPVIAANTKEQQGSVPPPGEAAAGSGDNLPQTKS